MWRWVLFVWGLCLLGLSIFLAGLRRHEFSYQQIYLSANWEGHYNLYVMEADGHGQQALRPRSINLNSKPQISPHGRWLSYIASYEAGHHLFIMRPNSQERQYLDEVQLPFLGASWSPDGQYLAYVGRGSTQIHHPVLRVIHWPSQTIHDLSLHGNVASLAAWSPDGRYLCYNAWGDLACVEREGEQFSLPQQKLNLGMMSSEPVWEPHGRGLMFISEHQGGSQLFYYDWQAQVLEQWTHDTTWKLHPLYSPDGRWLSYEADGGVYSMRPGTGQSPRLLSPPGQTSLSASWSADSRTVLFTSKVQEGTGATVAQSHQKIEYVYALYHNSPEGDELQRLTYAKRSALDPTWGHPQHLAFSLEHSLLMAGLCLVGAFWPKPFQWAGFRR
jgi:Tol biopolymer transport system component